MSIASPHHAAFPKRQEGRHPHCRFRGLLRLHSRYGPPNRSAAHRRPLSRGSDPCGYPHEPLVSYRINRQLSVWILPPLMIRAFGAHCQEPTYAPQQAVSLLDHLVGKQKERFRDLIARDRSLDLRDRNHCLSVDLAPYSGSLMPASRITLAYFSVSAA